MTRGDRIVERGSEGLQTLAEKAAERGGVAAKAAQPLAEDAAFLRKLRPSLIKARLRGDAPTNERPRPVRGPAPRSRDGSSSYLLVAAAAAGAGVLAAKLLDWRGHAHPRD
jgi:hypothetical protein